MSSIRLYRMQHHDGTGCYNNKTIVFLPNAKHGIIPGKNTHYLIDGDERWMNPDCDPPLYKYCIPRTKNNPWYYAFADKRHMFIWFLPDELKAYYDAGYSIYSLDVQADKVVQGKRQVIYHHEYVISSSPIELDSLLAEYEREHKEAIEALMPDEDSEEDELRSRSCSTSELC